MTRIAKTASQKEQELLATISDAKKKLEKLQNQQKLDIGSLACKCGLNEFDLKVLEKAFKNLATQLKNDK